MEIQTTQRVRPKRGTVVQMARMFKCSAAKISQHLAGVTNNDESLRIRKMAIELGGYVYNT